MGEWIKAHPYLTGIATLGLIVLFLVFRGRSSAASSPTVISGGPSDAVSVASLAADAQNNQTNAASRANTEAVNAALSLQTTQANDQLSAINTTNQAATDQTGILANAKIISDTLAAGVANTQTQAALTASTTHDAYTFATTQTTAAEAETEAESANAAMLASIQAQVGGAVSIAGINADAGVKTAGIQADVLTQQSKDALSAQRDIDTVSIQNTKTNGATSIALANIDAAVQNSGIAANLAAALDLNKTNLAIVNSNNGTVQNVTQINANRDVSIAGIGKDLQLGLAGFESATDIAQSTDLSTLYSHLIDANTETSNNQTNAWLTLQNNLLNAFSNVDFNRGGQGGANQVAAWSALFGQPQVGAAAEQAGGTGFNWGALLSGLGNLFAGIGKGATGVGIGAGTAGIATH